VCTLVSLSGLWTQTAAAQRVGGSRFFPAGSPDGVLGTEGADTRPAMMPYFELWMNYALNPVVVADAQGDESPIIEHFLGMDLIASMTVWKGLEFGVGLPVTLVRSGDDMAAAAVGLNDQSGAAFGDITLRAAYRFQLGYFTALAIHVPVLLPTTTRDNTLGLGFGVRPTLAFTHHFGPLQLLLNFSYLFRKSVSAGDYTGGQELGARLGLRFGFGEERLTGLLADVGVASATRDLFGAAETPAEARLGLEHRFADVWRITGMVGTGISTGIGAPDVRVGIGLGYVPELNEPRPTPEDRDGDGIANENDRCADEKEDEDGFQDADGCPEPDNDKDGVPDEDDECPRAPETINDFRDEDGCPDLVRLEGSEIITFEPVYFNSESTKVADRSKPMLKEVANIMNANPEMQLEVRGYADSQGAAGYNQKLSQQRADAVREFLDEEGVDDDRVHAKGYGERAPHASNETVKGRALNRRVEFGVRWDGSNP